FELLDRPAEWSRHRQAARAAVQQARVVAQSADGLADGSLNGEIERAEASLNADDAEYRLALALGQARLGRATSVERQYDHASAIAAYGRAFGQLEPWSEQSDMITLAEKIRKSPIREQLVAALDDWSLSAWLIGNEDLTGRLLALARQTDPDAVRD